jgi:integrase
VDAPKVTKKLLPTVTPEQMQILLKTADNPRDRAIISLLFDSGLRLSEMASIRTSEIDWDNNTLKVVVKGNRQAKAVFSCRTASSLREYLCANGHSPTLFGMKAGSIQDMLSRLSKQVDFPCNAHAFRRGFACNMHKRGLSTLTIMHLGRWSSLEMVARYTRSLTFDDCLELYQRATAE